MSNAARPFLPYGRQTISEEDIATVESVLRSPFLTQGPTVPDFEQAVSNKVNAHYGVAVNSATSALHIACLALGLGHGDQLWTTPITFVASANCGLYCGAKVDFVDINPETGLISIQELSKKLEKAERNGTLPKVLVPVHLCGSSCEMETIGELARRYGFSVLEDASHAVGAKYQNEPVGNCRHSSICVFSFHPVKIITTGEGGMATTNDPNLARHMADLRSHGITKDPERFERPAPGAWAYEQQELGYNYRMTDIQAALGLSQLERLDSIISERQQQLTYYSEILRDLPLRILQIPKNAESSVHLAVIQLNETMLHGQIFNELRNNGIGVQMHYTPVHLQPYYRRLGFKEGQFPNAERYSKCSISIPLYPGLTKSEQERVAETLSKLLRI